LYDRQPLTHITILTFTFIVAFIFNRTVALGLLLQVNLVTSSYVSDEMKALDAQAKAAGVTLMNEAGLDPGMDHMSAMKVIDAMKERGESRT
jgi:saccharopine dehydrogenase-like NADP-dependent oxidoreductase